MDSWYRDLEDALVLGQIPIVSRRSAKGGDVLLKPSDIVIWARSRGQAIPPEMDELSGDDPANREPLATA